MKRLVLLGGGHAQVQVVKAFATEAPPDTAVVLINRSRLTPYSGMLPGLIAGHYTHAECHIDLAWLCAQAHATFVEQEAIDLDLAAGTVRCADGSIHPYDILSIDTGSTPPLDAVPGASEYALPVKPIEGFLVQATAIVEACRAPGAHDIALVGGGAAGFEVLLGLVYRIKRESDRNAGVHFHWITDSAEILPTFSARVRAAALRLLKQRDVTLHSGAPVTRVSRNALELANGKHIVTQYAIWVTGAQPAAMFANTSLNTDARGFIDVDSCLRSTSHPNVFASGDVANVVEHPRPKAGVFAVRQGPSLTRNLRLALAGLAPLPFVPQEHFLVILSAGDRYAIATKAGYALEGRWVWTWKDWIDRRFMARFQPQS